MQTPLCDLFGIDFPLLNAPMGGGDAPGRLAAAISTAGGLGMIGGTTGGGERWLVNESARGVPSAPCSERDGAIGPIWVSQFGCFRDGAQINWLQ